MSIVVSLEGVRAMNPIDRVMQAYGLMVNLTPQQEEAARRQLELFLKTRTGSEQELAVQGLRFLRGARDRPRCGRKPASLVRNANC
jgi:hypothetical protein